MALAFDEPRLLEAVARLIDATGAYANSDVTLTIVPEKVSIGTREGGDIVLTAHVKGHGRVGLSMPRDAVKRLISQLRQYLGEG